MQVENTQENIATIEDVPVVDIQAWLDCQDP